MDTKIELDEMVLQKKIEVKTELAISASKHLDEYERIMQALKVLLLQLEREILYHYLIYFKIYPRNQRWDYTLSGTGGLPKKIKIW